MSNRITREPGGNTPANDDIQQHLQSFIELVGNRVLEARKQQGMSRRALSDLSGVSQRTIVLLETGAGNISISLLFRLSAALGESVQSLVFANSTGQSDAMQVSHYYLNASPLQQQKVQTLLGIEKQKNTKQRRICLIGLRGAGKSTLGKTYSKKTDTTFIELNKVIESLCSMSVEELMNLYGQEGYRKLEQQALKKITNQYNDVIVAASGGVVTEEETYTYLLRNFHTVWLKATPEEHIDRVRNQGDERPMDGNPEAMTILRSILVSREKQYRMADCTVDTSGVSEKHSLSELSAQIEKLIPA